MTARLDLSRSWKWFVAYLAIALVAFWPTYLSQPRASSVYTHLHALTATAWMIMLIVQSWAIGSRRIGLHRASGKTSYVLAPAVVLAMLLLAHDRIRLAPPGEGYAIQTYVLYLQVSLALLFTLSYALAIATRRSVARHSRFMVCTALTLIDPILIRIVLWVDPAPDWNPQWLTFGVNWLAFLVLIWAERHNRTGRGVFPIMLAVFVAVQLPAVLGFTLSPAWQAFAAWVAGL